MPDEISFAEVVTFETIRSPCTTAIVISPFTVVTPSRPSTLPIVSESLLSALPGVESRRETKMSAPLVVARAASVSTAMERAEPDEPMPLPASSFRPTAVMLPADWVTEPAAVNNALLSAVRLAPSRMSPEPPAVSVRSKLLLSPSSPTVIACWTSMFPLVVVTVIAPSCVLKPETPSTVPIIRPPSASVI